MKGFLSGWTRLMTVGPGLRGMPQGTVGPDNSHTHGTWKTDGRDKGGWLGKTSRTGTMEPLLFLPFIFFWLSLGVPWL